MTRFLFVKNSCLEIVWYLCDCAWNKVNVVMVCMGASAPGQLHVVWSRIGDFIYVECCLEANRMDCCPRTDNSSRNRSLNEW